MRLQVISEPLDIFHRNEFLDPVGTSFKFDRHARETVGWRRRRDPPKEAFVVDDERDGFACRQPCSSISRTVPRARRQGLVLCVPTILAPRPPRSAVVQGDWWGRSPMGCQALKD